MTAKKCIALLLLAVCLVLNCGCRSPKTDIPDFSGSWYYDHLSDAQKEIYGKVYVAKYNMEKSLFLGDCDEQDARLACYAVCSDRPEMFWTSSNHFIFTEDNGVTVGFSDFKISYNISKRDKDDFYKRLEMAVNEINKGITSDMTDFEKELYYHDWLCKNVEYAKSLDDDLLFTSYGALVNNTAVCEGYAKAMQLLCATQNIDCHLVFGYAQGSTGSFEGHTWNQIKIDGKYYNLDVTVNDSSASYDFFNVTDKQLENTHLFDKGFYLLTDDEIESNSSFNLSLPACTAQKYNYYSVFPKD